MISLTKSTLENKKQHVELGGLKEESSCFNQIQIESKEHETLK